MAERGEAKGEHSRAGPAALLDGLVVAGAEELGDRAVQRLSRRHQMKKTYRT